MNSNPGSSPYLPRRSTAVPNVAQVRQLSPFRYPGGKTWLMPQLHLWLAAAPSRTSAFIEPFAGGAMAGLTAAAERLADHVRLYELDDDVAAVWNTIFHASARNVTWLCTRINGFDVTLENVRAVLDSNPISLPDRAFRTIVKNRMQRGGVMAPGAGLIKAGEAGRGLKSRWYPETLVRRIEALQGLRGCVSFEQADAFDVIARYADEPDAVFFVDPPYTAGGKRAGKRLYVHNDVNHEALFSLIAGVRGAALLSYDDAPEVRALAARHGFAVATVAMKNAHHAVMQELLITKPKSG